MAKSSTARAPGRATGKQPGTQQQARPARRQVGKRQLPERKRAGGITEPSPVVLVTDPSDDTPGERRGPGRPTKLEGRRGYHRMQGVAELLALGANRALAAKGGEMSYDTLRQYELWGEVAIDLMDEDRAALLHEAAELFVQNEKGHLASLPDAEFPRAAKFLAVMEAADAMYLRMTLAGIAKSIQKGNAQAALSQISRKFRDADYSEPTSVTIRGDAANPLRAIVETVAIEIPLNGFELKEEESTLKRIAEAGE